jgi:hypothetical protein
MTRPDLFLVFSRFRINGSHLTSTVSSLSLFSLHPSSRSQRRRCLRDRVPMIEVSSAETARPSCSQGRAPEPLRPCDLPSASPPSSCRQSLLSLILLYDITAPLVIFFSGFVFCSGPTCAPGELGLPAQHPYKGRAKTLRPVPYHAAVASSLFPASPSAQAPLPFLSCSHANAARTPRSASPSLCCPGRRPCAVRTIRRTAAIAPYFFCTEPPCPAARLPPRIPASPSAPPGCRLSASCAPRPA